MGTPFGNRPNLRIRGIGAPRIGRYQVKTPFDWPHPPTPASHSPTTDPMTMTSRPLLAQVLAVNLLLVAVTVLVATVAVDAQLTEITRDRQLLVLGLAILATTLGNWLLLRRRFEPLGQLISSMEEIDLAQPASDGIEATRADSAEVKRLEAAFGRMIARLEAERRDAGRAAVEAQERERRRIAQDLHDEVNQALTAVSLRLQASIEHAPPELRAELTETKQLSTRAMEELLALARQLRPAVLDDHGLVPALSSQVRLFGEQTGIRASFTVLGGLPELAPSEQLVIYRITQESLSNIAQHAGARTAAVELSFDGRTRVTITDDGRGFSGHPGEGLGLSGMRERAMLAGGELSITSTEGHGTRVELRL
jgi:two-component system sensor histidine kinase UhpB